MVSLPSMRLRLLQNRRLWLVEGDARRGLADLGRRDCDFRRMPSGAEATGEGKSIMASFSEGRLVGGWIGDVGRGDCWREDGEEETGLARVEWERDSRDSRGGCGRPSRGRDCTGTAAGAFAWVYGEFWNGDVIGWRCRWDGVLG